MLQNCEMPVSIQWGTSDICMRDSETGAKQHISRIGGPGVRVQGPAWEIDIEEVEGRVAQEGAESVTPVTFRRQGATAIAAVPATSATQLNKVQLTVLWILPTRHTGKAIQTIISGCVT